ncbi:MAG TPA: hypothetical protein VE439_00570 [Anaerolineae bacterium]|jgi:hypothetical protein|nr:hypothetical protein [Anaerolineae bacterium]
MGDNGTDEVLPEVTGSAAKVDRKRQVARYILIWLAIVVLFLAFNMVIKAFATSRSAGTYNTGSYTAGQPVANDGQVGEYEDCDGTCCGTGTYGQAASGGGQVDASDPKQIEKAAIEWYAQKTGDRDVTAEVQDFGCHQQITIKKDGKAVSEISFRNGQFQSLTPW